MITTIIAVGNSRGIRIPKPLLKESGLKETVELSVRKGEIRITPAPTKKVSAGNAMLSEKALSADWNKPEEDAAWKSLQ